MSEMIKRVARLLCRQRYPNIANPDAIDAFGKPTWVEFVRDAREVIEAMRVPTMDMMDAGKQRFHEPMFYGAGRMPYLQDAGAVVWERAIEAALSD